jgi:undecaprenyl-diphosphatase
LLISTQLVKAGNRKIPFLDAFVMGLAQAIATVPGISRSGATISAGLLMKNNRSEVARFSFLMVLLPIIGAALLDILSFSSSPAEDGISLVSLVIGFVSAFLSGYLACTWMISLVKKGNLYWFAIYCALVGIASIIFA